MTFLSKTLGVSLGLLLILSAYAEDTITVKPGPNSTPKNTARISDVANLLVDKIQQAESAIDQNELGHAQRLLSQAQDLVQNIEMTGPTARVIEHIHTARTTLETSTTVPLDLVPLDAELTDVDKIVSVQKAREQLTLAQQNIQANQREAARKNLLAVEDNLVYAEADLPVSRTKVDILSAETLLNQNRPLEAREMLQDSLNHISVMAVDVQKSTPIDEKESNQ